MTYDIIAKIENDKVVYYPKYKKRMSKGHRLRLLQRVNEHNKKGDVEIKPNTPKEQLSFQMKLFIE